MEGTSQTLLKAKIDFNTPDTHDIIAAVTGKRHIVARTLKDQTGNPEPVAALGKVPSCSSWGFLGGEQQTMREVPKLWIIAGIAAGCKGICVLPYIWGVWLV